MFITQSLNLSLSIPHLLLVPQANMVAMYRQSLDRPASDLPPPIGPDARRLWRPPPPPPAGLASTIGDGSPASDGSAAPAASALLDPLLFRDSEPVVDAA